VFARVIVTKVFLEHLFSSFSLPLPDVSKIPEVPLSSPNDVLPSGVNEEELAYTGTSVLCAGIYMFGADLAPAKFDDDGAAHSFHTVTAIAGESGNGWVGIETVLTRLGDRYAPNAKFPVWGDPVAIEKEYSSRIGYDAVVCVEMYEPWVVQIYNSSLGVPTTMTIVGKSASTDFETDDGNRGPHLDSYTRVLNSTGKYPAYSVRCVGSFSFERY